MVISMSEEYLKQMLLLSECLLNKDLDGAKKAAGDIGKLELKEDDELSIKDIIRSNYTQFSFDELKSIIDCLNFDEVDVLLAEIELEQANSRNTILTSAELKKTKGYLLISQGSVEDENDRYNLLRPLVLLTIGTRDSELIQEMLQIMEG